eukprot:5766615-Amphidinium_carterae.1
MTAVRQLHASCATEEEGRHESQREWCGSRKVDSAMEGFALSCLSECVVKWNGKVNKWKVTTGEGTEGT